MFDDVVKVRDKDGGEYIICRPKSMLTERSDTLANNGDKLKSIKVCTDSLRPNSKLEGLYQPPRPRSVGPIGEIRKEPAELRSWLKNNTVIHSFTDKALDDANIIRSECHLARLNTQLLEAVEHGNAGEAERLIINGANPNATCRLGHDSACHIAALVGGDSLSVLLKCGADKNRSSKLGRTPIHMAAWAGNIIQIALLLGLPEHVLSEIENELAITKNAYAKIRTLHNGLIKSMANVKTEIGLVTVLAKTWKDSIEHKCEDLKLPFIKPTWTPLHVASSCVRHHAVHLLLAAGADPNTQDMRGLTPLDVAGSAFYKGHNINYEHEIIKILLEAGGRFRAAAQRHGLNETNSPLHTAIELGYLDLAEIIVISGVSITHLNKAGESPMHVCVRKKITEIEMFSKYNTLDDKVAYDIRDKKGVSVLHAAVKAKWLPGVRIALENGADVTLQANNGEAPIHSAAEIGDVDILREILSIAKKNQTLENRNRKNETVLFKAIKHGRLDCVQIILDEGACIHRKLLNNFNILHAAAMYGNPNILEVLLNRDDVKKSSLINELTYGDRGPSPLHLAVELDNVKCVELLLNNNADSRLHNLYKTGPLDPTTPLQTAVVNNNLEIAKMILKNNIDTIHGVNTKNWTALHLASFNGHAEIVRMLIRNGADITMRTDKLHNRQTCMSFIMNYIPKPTQFMEEVFDSYITNDEPHLVEVNYEILTSNFGPSERLKVVETLLETGNGVGQRRLLVHPLVESFLYLNWVALLPFFYVMLGLYGINVLSLNIFITSSFYYKDTKNVPPAILNPAIWSILIYITGALMLAQEVLYIKFGSRTYYYRLESWIKLSAICFAVIIPVILSVWPEDAWPRHVGTITLSLSWIVMMFMISRLPNWGYYFMMFGKVLTKVLKILLAFVFLIIGFALSFMVQFHSQAPFNDPWAAFVKTMVMMTSEFDYVNLFDDKQTKDLAMSLIVIRILFLIFLILAGIVLMNLMVAVAVNDLSNLEMHGNIRRLEKQVEFLSSFQAVVYNKYLIRHLPNWLIWRTTLKKISLQVLKKNSILPMHLCDAIFSTAVIRGNKSDDGINNEILNTKLDKIYEMLKELRSGILDSNSNLTQSLD